MHKGEGAPPSDFRRRWTRVSTPPESWLAGEVDWRGGEDALLVAVHGELLRLGLVDAGLVRLLAERRGETRILVLLEGLNRRGLAARTGSGRPVLEALAAGEVETLLLFGLEPGCDLEHLPEWREAVARADRILIQSHGLGELEGSAEVLLARRRAVDLVGTIHNTFGLARRMRSWEPVAGVRPMDLDWLAAIGEEVAP